MNSIHHNKLAQLYSIISGCVNVSLHTMSTVNAFASTLGFPHHTRRGRGRGPHPNWPAPKFWGVGKLSENLLTEKFSPKMQNLELKVKIPILGKFRLKIEILSMHNLVCQKLQLPVPPISFV